MTEMETIIKIIKALSESGGVVWAAVLIYIVVRIARYLSSQIDCMRKSVIIALAIKRRECRALVRIAEGISRER